VTGRPFVARTRLVYGAGSVARLGDLARELGFRRALLVSDPGLVASGHPARAEALLRAARVETASFHEFDHDPDSDMVQRGADAARAFGADAVLAKPFRMSEIVQLSGRLLRRPANTANARRIGA